MLKIFMLSAISLPMLASCSGAVTVGAETEVPGPAVVVNDAWAKATDKVMTGVFGDIKNVSDKPVTVESVASLLSGAELHEVSRGVMKKSDKGFTVAPHSVFTLSPGANHIMLMGLKAPLAAGEEIPITLRLDSGEEIKFTATVKEYTGANENYAP